MSVKDLVFIALGAALVAAFNLLPPVFLPFFPVPVPLTAQTLGVMLAGALFGTKRGFFAVWVFLLLVAAGLPFLSGGGGGFGAFFRPSAGYLIGFAFGAGAIGFLYETCRTRLTVAHEMLFLILGGIIVIDLFGIAGLMLNAGLSLRESFLFNLQFIPGDIIKAALALMIARRVRKALPGLSPNLPFSAPG